MHPVDYVELVAVTYGHDLGLYRTRKVDVYDTFGMPDDPDLLVLPNGHTIDTSRLDKDVTMFVEMAWTPVGNAAGYEISVLSIRTAHGADRQSRLVAHHF